MIENTSNTFNLCGSQTQNKIWIISSRAKSQWIHRPEAVKNQQEQKFLHGVVFEKICEEK